MQASIEISMYPLQEDYCQPIIDFIDRLETHSEVRIARNAMSTQVFGEFRTLMSMMTEEVETVLATQPKTVFVLKLIGTDRSKARIDACSE
ncbi:hypothetical protein [Hydrogenovibrio sp. JE_KL2]|uniref:hypothetical protein n=1 Tax=Hydrogenovibrio sp. JE_KL2 TaxID=2651188 RepID=UPI00128DEDFB|nr:hypothetical protein [Hydrogenovibrio sp. JE_KL2]MPQ77249.1 hypothetical protein [Hydrogenovibrio sp. JE_KL2]